MIYKHILVASGGAEHSRAAEARAVALAQHFSAQLSLITVARYNLPASTIGVGLDMGMPISTENYLDDIREKQQSILDEALLRCKNLGIVPTSYLGIGNAGEAIVAKAKELSADIIVVGSRKMSLLDTVVRGSVSDYIMRHADMDVLIVHPSE